MYRLTTPEEGISGELSGVSELEFYHLDRLNGY